MIPATPARIATDDSAIPLQPSHAFGHDTVDWHAAEIWLRTVGDRTATQPSQTVSPYRFHLAKLRWFCEQGAQGAIIGLEWAGHSYISDFLMDFPVDSLCRVKGTRNVSPDEAGYTPFRRQPSLGSQLEIRRDAHAVFNAWHKAAGIVRLTF